MQNVDKVFDDLLKYSPRNTIGKAPAISGIYCGIRNNEICFNFSPQKNYEVTRTSICKIHVMDLHFFFSEDHVSMTCLRVQSIDEAFYYYIMKYGRTPVGKMRDICYVASFVPYVLREGVVDDIIVPSPATGNGSSLVIATITTKTSCFSQIII